MKRRELATTDGQSIAIIPSPAAVSIIWSRGLDRQHYTLTPNEATRLEHAIRAATREARIAAFEHPHPQHPRERPIKTP